MIDVRQLKEAVKAGKKNTAGSGGEFHRIPELGMEEVELRK